MIQDGRPARLCSLDVSIKLSLESARMKNSPQAVALLQILCLLANGLCLHNPGHRHLLDHIVDAPVKCSSVLKQVALAYTVVDSKGLERLRALAPLRTYILAQHWPDSHLLEPIKQYFFHIFSTAKRIGFAETPELLTQMTPEIANVESLIECLL